MADERSVFEKASFADLKDFFHTILYQMRMKESEERKSYIGVGMDFIDQGMAQIAAFQLKNARDRLKRVASILRTGDVAWKVPSFFSDYALKLVTCALMKTGPTEPDLTPEDACPLESPTESASFPMKLTSTNSGEMWDLALIVLWEMAKREPSQEQEGGTGGLNLAKQDVLNLAVDSMKETVEQLHEVISLLNETGQRGEEAGFYAKIAAKLLNKSLMYLNVFS